MGFFSKLFGGKDNDKPSVQGMDKPGEQTESSKEMPVEPVNEMSAKQHHHNESACGPEGCGSGCICDESGCNCEGDEK